MAYPEQMQLVTRKNDSSRLVGKLMEAKCSLGKAKDLEDKNIERSHRFFHFYTLKKNNNKISKDCRRIYILVAMNTTNLDFISYKSTRPTLYEQDVMVLCVFF